MTGESAWMHTVMARLAAELTTAQYEALMLHWEGRSYEQIGEALIISKQAAYGAVKRAEKNARKIAQEERDRDRTPQ